MSWTCGVSECGQAFSDPEQLLAHQARQHTAHTCRICDQVVPAGYFAIKHVFEQHRRSAYVRAYGADSAAIRRRERSLKSVTEAIDDDSITDLLERIEDSSLAEAASQ